MTDGEEAEDAAFLSQVAAWIEGAVRAGAGSFAALLEQLPSVYPTVVRQAVQLLVSRNRIAPARASALIAAEPNVPGQPRARSFLPLPHPLNYEWRFTPKGSDMLLDAADAL